MSILRVYTHVDGYRKNEIKQYVTDHSSCSIVWKRVCCYCKSSSSTCCTTKG